MDVSKFKMKCCSCLVKAADRELGTTEEVNAYDKVFIGLLMVFQASWCQFSILNFNESSHSLWSALILLSSLILGEGKKLKVFGLFITFWRS